MLTEPGLADTLGLGAGIPKRLDGFSAALWFEITAKNRESLLRDITALLADQGLPIAKASGEVLEEDMAVIKVEVTLSTGLPASNCSVT